MNFYILISINLDFGTTQYVFSNELSIGAIENINQATVQSSPQPVEPLTENYNQSGEIKTIDFNEYYLLSGKTVPNYQICTLGNANTIPEYNKQYSDAFIVLNLFLKSPSIIQHNANNPMIKFVIAIEVGIVIPNKINKTCCVLFTTLFIT